MLLLACLRAGSGFKFLVFYKGCCVRLTSVYSPESTSHTQSFWLSLSELSVTLSCRKLGAEYFSYGQVSCSSVPVALGPSSVPFLKTVYEISGERMSFYGQCSDD